MSKIDLGAVTAYADAVAQGYTGTREQFGKDQAEFAKNAAQVAENLKASEKVLAEQVNAIYAAAEVKKQEISDIGTVLVGEQSLTAAERARVRSNLDTACAITETASGEHITLSDASDQHFRGLTLYGKSVQNGTPTPSAPVDIVSVGDSGETMCIITGAQLLNFPDVAGRNFCGITWECSGGMITATGTAEESSYSSAALIKAELPKGISGVFTLSGGADGVELLASAIKADGTNASLRGTFTLDGTEDSVTVYAYVRSGKTVDVSFAPMLNSGEIALPWKPYISQVMPLTIPDGLPGIPVQSGGNYTDADGQQWICDEMDFGRGVYVQRVGVLTSAQSLWGFTLCSSAWQIDGATAAYSYISNLNSANRTEKACLSNKFAAAEWEFKHTDLINLVYTREGRAYFRVSNEFTGIASGDSDSVKTQKIQDYLGGLTDIKLVYILAEPVETPLSETALAAYRALHTNKPHTTIFTDGNAGISVEYAADTKTYIDNKFAELRADLLNN